jgi:hypothetical protein
MSLRKALLPFLAVILFVSAAPRSGWKDVEQALGRAGSVLPGGVYKVSFPRSDLSVTADGVSIKPPLALGSWVAFKETANGHVMVMGDLVLLESEINPVIDILQAGGIEQSALHNHLIGETPHVMYLHIGGHGDAVKLATTLHAALAATGTPMTAASAAAPAPLDLPTADLDRIIGSSGKANGGVDQFSVPRAETIREHGEEVPPSMGTATAINFQPTGNGRAAISGDFVMTAAEVNPVIRALRAGGIRVTAVHSHMLDETPRLFFMHFWANEDALKLAATLRTALDRMHVKH